jgi:NAD(P)-dependent dehydrogenase (short-subunit alcohol dehydrogenase family)
MSNEYAGQVVVVTGASGGIGRATARAFGAQGAKVALLARGKAGLAGAVRDVEQAGGEALAIPTDVADPDQVEAAAAQAEKALGPIDVWVNVAFTSVFAQFTDISPAEYKRVTEVSYLGYVYGTMAALKRMQPRDAGTIVQVGSALAYRGIPLQTAYCGAKHAIQGFNEALRCELLHNKSNVHVTMVQMPAVNTPQFDWVLSRLPKPAQPVPPIYQPEVAAHGVLYAAGHPGRREYWVGGSTAATLAANAVAPGLLDRYLARTGYSAQQDDRPEPSSPPANLWKPADSPAGHDYTAHGSFDQQSKPRSVQLWGSQHHGLLGGALLGLAGVAGIAGVAAAALGRRGRR